MVLRLTRALRTWWRPCSDDCAMPQSHKGSTRERVCVRERDIARDGEGWRVIERRQRISDILGGIKRNHQQRARAQ